MINFIENKLIIEIECLNFQWYYRFSDRFKFNRLSSKTNECNFIGHGEYLCETENEKFQIFLNSGVDVSNIDYEIIKSQKKEWDFSRLTEDQKNEVKLLVKEKNYLKLMKFHNSNSLSENHFCCNKEYVYNKFVEAIKNNLI